MRSVSILLKALAIDHKKLLLETFKIMWRLQVSFPVGILETLEQGVKYDQS